jgi:hypothetical protein
LNKARSRQGSSMANFTIYFQICLNYQNSNKTHRYEYMFLTINYKNSINWIRVKESGFEPQALIAVHQYAFLKIELEDTWYTIYVVLKRDA